MPLLPDITLTFPPLARGPLSVIYRGWDRAHRCPVIVKAQRATDDPVAVNRFGREAAVMLRLRHPSIVTLYAFHAGEASKNDAPALVMEYVPGQTLAALVAARGPLSVARAARLVEEIAAALDCIHALGIVHRDVKPSNILLPQPSILFPARGSAKLTDFGVARIDDDLPLTVMGDILGTIEYASPEQVHGNGAVDARSDVYSLAAVSYFALTGTPPFRAADSSTQAQLSVMHRQVFAAPPPLRLHREDLDPAIEAAVLRGLAKTPEARYDSAGQLAAALRAAVTSASGEPQQAAMKASARRTGALAGAAASVVLLLAGVTLWKTGEFGPVHPLVPVRAAEHKPSEHKPAPPPVPLASVKPRPAPLRAAVAPVVRTASVSAFPRMPAAKPGTQSVAAARAAHRKLVKVASSPDRPVSTSQHVSQNSERVPLAPNNGGIRRRNILLTPPLLGAGGRFEIHSKHVASKSVALKSVASERVTLKPAAAKRRQLAAISRPPVPTVAVPHLAVPAVPPKPLIVPLAPSSPPVPAPHLAVAAVGWYTVTGWIALADQTAAQKTQLVPAYPLWIKVDGQPYPALASGQWAQLPAGIHTVIYQPTAGLGVGPKTWTITLAPSAHLSQQVPLPATPLPAIPLHLRNP